MHGWAQRNKNNVENFTANRNISFCYCELFLLTGSLQKLAHPAEQHFRSPRQWKSWWHSESQLSEAASILGQIPGLMTLRHAGTNEKPWSPISTTQMLSLGQRCPAHGSSHSQLSQVPLYVLDWPYWHRSDKQCLTKLSQSSCGPAKCFNEHSGGRKVPTHENLSLVRRWQTRKVQKAKTLSTFGAFWKQTSRFHVSKDFECATRWVSAVAVFLFKRRELNFAQESRMCIIISEKWIKRKTHELRRCILCWFVSFFVLSEWHRKIYSSTHSPLELKTKVSWVGLISLSQ